MYTEQNIRGLAINFLRQHYKLRPRSGTSGTRVVHKPHYYEGVTIDARLAYQKPDLNWFTATVEASGIDQAHEVLYRVNYFRIGVHALVITLAVMALFMAGTQVQGVNLWQSYGRPAVYFLLLNIFLVLWAIAGLGLSQLRYYRYIYAIAQFMRFHADAQWVAYDQKIFSNIASERRSNRFYRELQRQCLRFGFGLMEIQPDNKVRWLIEPSHVDQFEGRRSRLPVWVAAAASPPKLIEGLRKRLPLGSKNAPAAAPGKTPAPPVPTDGYTDPLSVENYTPVLLRNDNYAATIVPAKKGKTPWFKQPMRLMKSLRWRIRHAIRSLYPDEIRKRPGYYELSWWVFVIGISSFLTFGGLAWVQSDWSQERRPGQVAAAPDLEHLESAETPDDSDEVPEVLEGEYDHSITAAEAGYQTELDLTPELIGKPIVAPTRPAANAIQYFRYAAGGTIERSYGCGPLGRVDASGLILLEGLYPVYDIAIERAKELNTNFSIPASVLLADCLEEGAPGYLLYLGEPVQTEAEANLLLRRYARDMDLEMEVLVVK
ncbi:ABC transporter permease [Neolewinella persica]|uniref:hypothetical protein n=1 Tax=Neolewinella persica TaxID=70998 RepID=UPI000380EBA1|nr:hypothetical protein [Neolewinella persica]